jgi:4-amino-4-deoxy-L-arabinose transferase-like glycosyltransferase
MDLPRSSPARLTALATLKLPRGGLILIGLLYILPGLVGRDPWKSEDATGFGVMWTMAHGTLRDWLIPNIAGATVFDSGPLAYWFGAACIKLLAGSFGGWIDAPLAARVATVALFLMAATALWYSTYLLGRRSSAQPLALAFGGHPAPRDYGRTLADGAFLILLGTLGLAARAHESSSDVGMLTMLCFFLYGATRSLDRPYVGAIWVAVALVGLVLTRGPYPAVALLLVWIALILVHPDWRAARPAFIVVTAPLGLLGLSIWPFIVGTFDPTEVQPYFEARRHFWIAYGSGIDLEALRKWGRNFAWFALPGWPIAAWACWSWRGQRTTPHLLLPLAYLAALIGVLLSTPDSADGLLLMLLPGIVILAAFGLPTLKRGAANAIDWFSLLVYSLTALGIWLSWITRLTGFPASYARTMARLVPGLNSEFEWLPFLFALLISAAWIWIVYWRVTTHPKVLWRSVVLASGGVTLCWGLAMTIMLPELDYSRSYRDVAVKLEKALPAGAQEARACVSADGLGLPQRASFAYFAGIRFARMEFDGEHESETCPYLLRQDLTRDPRTALPQGHWQAVWEGRRASDRDERYRLFRRLKSTGPATTGESARTSDE